MSEKHPLIRLLSYASDFRSKIYLGVAASVINKIFDLAPPVLIGTAVDVVVSQQNSFLAKFGIEQVSTQLWLLAGLTLIIWAFESLFDYIAEVIWRGLAQSIQHELRVDTFSNLQSLELAYFEDRSSGDLMAVLNDDVNQLERFLDSGAHEIVILATTIVSVGALFLFMVPEIAWMTLLPIPVIGWGSLYFQKLIAPRYRAVREQAGVINSQLVNSLGGIATVKSYTSEFHETERIIKLSKEYSDKNRAAIRLSAAFVPLIRMVIVLGFAAIMVYAGERVVAGTLNVGVYSILVFMTQRLLWPLTTLGKTLDLYQRAMASTARILKVLFTTPIITGGSTVLDKGRVIGNLEFKNVDFAYKDRQPVLDNLNLKIQPGQNVGIVGSTGSGKTTLIKLLLRLYDTTAGDLLIENISIKDLTLDSLRDSIALVSQDVFLIDGSVKENISYGTFDAADKDIIEAARFSEAHGFIEKLPLGYETIVGERGQKLSGGQRQRLAIARALLKDAPILILDEATSSVDNETEAAIQRAIEKLSHKKTLIVIAHRLSTVRNSDVIFVLDAGKVVEQGTHEELISAQGLYASLWQVQTGAKEDANITS